MVSCVAIALWGLAVAAIGYMIANLRARGRPWHRNKYSQGWLDAWSITHVGHGIVLFGLAKSVFPGMTYGFLAIVVTAEALWESFENRNWVIRLFRSAGDKNYFGDSVANSLGDVLACVAGGLFTSFFI